jgi:cyclic pyranopterin phosphate synthase
VKKNIRSICQRIGALPGLQELCLTTNGTLLPELAEDLRAAGVSRINLSLDSLQEETYAEITRGGSLKQALLGLETALNTGFEKVKINMVLLGGRNENEVPDFAALTRKYPVDVRFIEWMPMYRGGDLDEHTVYSCAQALEQIRGREGTLLPQPEDGGVAKLYRIPGALGNIGLITPVSAHFCKDCRRIRISADGKLKPCLHSPQEISLKGLSYEEMKEQMETAIWQKPESHSRLSAETPSQAGRSMNQIGG